ncbi:MAG: hypothetical protein IJ801_03045 [Lachnospiraceae bacterium]|nr:hypothetical protein [Lachnospiraceae bacterium]
MDVVDLIKKKYDYDTWNKSRSEPVTQPFYAMGSIRMPFPEGYRLIESLPYSVAGSFRNTYVSEAGDTERIELIVAPCGDVKSAQEMMLNRLCGLQTPMVERMDRWNTNVGFYCQSDGGASQMICRENLFVCITLWSENGEVNAGSVLDNVWNSFMQEL